MSTCNCLSPCQDEVVVDLDAGDFDERRLELPVLVHPEVDKYDQEVVDQIFVHFHHRIQSTVFLEDYLHDHVHFGDSLLLLS